MHLYVSAASIVQLSSELFQKLVGVRKVSNIQVAELRYAVTQVSRELAHSNRVLCLSICIYCLQFVVCLCLLLLTLILASVNR